MSETDKLARIVRLGLYFFGVLFLVLGVYEAKFGPITLFRPLDTSDDPMHRSGLRIHTDNLTGCQYLSDGNGLTPRLGATGAVVCGLPKYPN